MLLPPAHFPHLLNLNSKELATLEDDPQPPKAAMLSTMAEAQNTWALCACTDVTKHRLHQVNERCHAELLVVEPFWTSPITHQVAENWIICAQMILQSLYVEQLLIVLIYQVPNKSLFSINVSPMKINDRIQG